MKSRKLKIICQDLGTMSGTCVNEYLQRGNEPFMEDRLGYIHPRELIVRDHQLGS